MRETGRSGYKVKLTHTLRRLYPDCHVITGNSASQQGIPDLMVVWNDKWAMLEVKGSADAAKQPNQQYFVDKFNNMSFAAFIYPENEEEVLRALQQAFAKSSSRSSEPE